MKLHLHLLLSVGLLAAASSQAATLTLQASADTSLISANGGNQNVGASQELWVLRNAQTTLIRFDLPSYDGLTLEEATLGLGLKNFTQTTTAMEVQVYALAEANRAWVEGDGAAYPGNYRPGASTWSNQLHGPSATNTSDNGTPWASGVTGATGGSPVLLGTWSLTGSEEAGYLELVIDDADVLALWAGYGFVDLLLVNPSGTNRAVFHSRESESTALQPYLTINYTTIPEAGAGHLLGAAFLTLLSLRGGSLVRKKFHGKH
ncbi:MAG TPA: hypothetical protein VNQ90_12495 [Chthoniobacteraceae bacterium]|nr:hypothetical protein [Chthoniobacteraceae bacterium]